MLPRDATDAYLASAGHGLDIVFDVDLGQLVQGHHVIARGIDLGREVEVQRWQQERNERLAAKRTLDVDVNGAGFGLSRRILSEKDLEVVGSQLLESELHYEFVPGLLPERQGEPFYWYWMLQVSDDIGTPYADSNNGTRGPSTGGPATHATRDLGARVPDEATRLLIAITPASDWFPQDPWVRELEIDLRLRTVISAK